jgi:hypothetical protein
MIARGDAPIDAGALLSRFASIPVGKDDVAESGLRRIFVGSPRSLGARARLRRWAMFRESFPDFERMRVLDLGGTVDTWQRSPIRPSHVTVLNLFHQLEADDDTMVLVNGDACCATDVLEAAGVDMNFDLVFSNSLIEHVGGHARRADFAKQVRDLAPRHWVQTPYRYFPVEPHWLFPGMQFMPLAARKKVAVHWPLGFTRNYSAHDAHEQVFWTELLSLTEMRDHFPTSTIRHERVFGLTKSLIALAD